LLAEGETLEVFRVVHRADLNDPELWRDLRSKAQEGKPLIGSGPEAELDHQGRSVWSNLEQARATVVAIAKRYGLPPNSPELRIGRHVAQLMIGPSHGVRYLRDDKPPGHVTIWGDPAVLAAAVVAIHPVWQT
jgi:hypothetical protein